MRRQLTSRREFISRSILAAAAFSARRVVGEQGSGETVVKTPLGVLRGLKGDGGVRIFRGVPFAQPPVGALRFRAPVRVDPWTNVRDATTFGASPMQTGEAGVRHSEDCLYLNVWAPEGKGPFPVFVWIHGGGFTNGHAFESMYDGLRFARQGIVCITVAYRLGAFGFVDLEPVLGAEYAGSANNGIRDLLSGLEWVRANVASFGGDPGRVTVGGESAGAKLTDILMGVPTAKPLFEQAISESGGAERVWPLGTAKGIGQAFGEAWQKKSAKAAATLLNAPGEEIVALQKQFLEDWPQHFPFRPELDGQLMTRLPVQEVADGNASGKRFLAGTNREESAMFLGPHPEHDPIAQNLGNLSLASFDETFARYKALYPEMTDEQRRIRAVTAEEYWIPTIRLTDAHVKAGGSAWMYELAFTESSGRFSGFAYHGLDVPLVWEKPHTDVTNAAAEAALALQMHDAWVAFIRGEVPAAKGLPVWPTYDPRERKTMILDAVSRVEERPQEKELQLWDGKL